ncbi:MAG: hypothetical protein IKZ95_00495 [Lachnospiraceae bacterium]|nr:hypothetical protein [Lachnospiraceae bacterium]
MITRIVYPSALEYWLFEKGIPYRYWNTGKGAPGEEKQTGRTSITEIVGRLNFTTPVHVAVPRTTNRQHTKTIIYHALPKALPKNSFIQITDNVLISSPEMCFLQAALTLPLHQLVKLACELCAIYVPDSYEEYGQRSREQITSVSNIRDYLLKATGARGVKKAKEAIQYASDRANSPMEVNLATIAALPICHGGFGTKKMLLNNDVLLSESGAAHLGRESCCCDIVWPEEKVVLEYDSNLSHLSRQQHAKDKARITALSLSGYKVFSVTADDLKSYGRIEALFLLVRSALGMRTHNDRMEKNLDKRIRVVNAIMFSVAKKTW